ncbi:hypothetical protein R3W88_019346 [Solanum pinnatisectum]|uniref:Ubiquitin-like protease family profile domain-containing protein n=1 Tax=Solanum pinnatisectum TaxID=50273 RepID=A0AAV9KJE5_9SOLN|nr:hypothetical protein R3W88_019346 [Solanum pinnatisectum]
MQQRNRNPDKYDTSSYICLSEGESSVRRDHVFYRKAKINCNTGHNVYTISLLYILHVNRKSTYSKAKNKFEPPMNFGVEKVSEMDWFNIMVKSGRSSEDRICKVFSTPLSYNTSDCWFMSWVDNIEKQVDDVIIPINVSTSFHWFLVVFRTKLSSLHIYDSMMGGVMHIRNVNKAVDKLATMPLFLTSTKFYGKGLDLYSNKQPAYVGKPQSDRLKVYNYGMYTCLFAEYINNEVFDMDFIDIDAKYHSQRYATIIWQYGKNKNDDGAISESVVTGTVASKFCGPRIAKEYASDTTNYPTPRPLKSKLK